MSSSRQYRPLEATYSLLLLLFCARGSSGDGGGGGGGTSAPLLPLPVTSSCNATLSRAARVEIPDLRHPAASSGSRLHCVTRVRTPVQDRGRTVVKIEFERLKVGCHCSSDMFVCFSYAIACFFIDRRMVRPQNPQRFFRDRSSFQTGLVLSHLKKLLLLFLFLCVRDDAFLRATS